jgi:hypothetical protein
MPIFVDMNTHEITYSQHKIPSYGTSFINTATGDVWTWDPISQQIWKVSSTDISFMGSVGSATFVHVDPSSGHLYFMS